MTLIPGTAAGSGKEMGWPLAARLEQETSRGVLDLTGTPDDRAALKQATVEARIALEEAAVAAAVAAQRAFTFAEVLDEALAVLEESDGAVAPAPPPALSARIPVDVLSPRETEVLVLVAEGRTNKAIAESLFVSPNTVKTHVASLLNKLHADTRAQLAAMAARGGLR